MKNESRDDLEHASIVAMIKIMAADIDSNFKVLHAENRAEFDVIGATLKSIEKETKLTNGRIAQNIKDIDKLKTDTEKEIKEIKEDTDIIKFFKKYKWVFPLCVMGLLALYKFPYYNVIWSLIKSVF